jgi:hypothetical protein
MTAKLPYNFPTSTGINSLPPSLSLSSLILARRSLCKYSSIATLCRPGRYPELNSENVEETVNTQEVDARPMTKDETMKISSETRARERSKAKEGTCSREEGGDAGRLSGSKGSNGSADSIGNFVAGESFLSHLIVTSKLHQNLASWILGKHVLTW